MWERAIQWFTIVFALLFTVHFHNEAGLIFCDLLVSFWMQRSGMNVNECENAFVVSKAVENIEC